MLKVKALYQNIRVPRWLTQPRLAIGKWKEYGLEWLIRECLRKQMILGGRAQTRFEIRTTCSNTIAEELGVTNILTPK